MMQWATQRQVITKCTDRISIPATNFANAGHVTTSRDSFDL